MTNLERQKKDIVYAFGNQIGRHEGSFTLRYVGSNRWNTEEKKLEPVPHRLDELLERGQEVLADRIDIGRSKSEVRLHLTDNYSLNFSTDCLNSVLFEWIANNNMSYI